MVAPLWRHGGAMVVSWWRHGGVGVLIYARFKFRKTHKLHHEITHNTSAPTVLSSSEIPHKEYDLT